MFTRPFSGRTRVVLALIGPLGLLLAGCSSEKTATVTGTVRYQSQPLKAGLIKFHGADRVASAMIQADGSYLCPDAPMGDVKVTVELIAAGLPGEKKTMAGTGPGVGMPGAMPGGKLGGMTPPGAVPPTVPGKAATEKIAKAPDSAPPVPDAGVKLPSNYKSPDTSGLAYTIDAKEKQIDIDLK